MLELWHIQSNISFGVDAKTWTKDGLAQHTSFSTDWAPSLEATIVWTKHFSFWVFCGLNGEPVLKCLFWVARADYLLRVYFCAEQPFNWVINPTHNSTLWACFHLTWGREGIRIELMHHWFNEWETANVRQTHTHTHTLIFWHSMWLRQWERWE